MAEPTPADLTARLLAEGFSRTTPDATALSDPIANTPIVLTLDQLRPFDLNPRITRNPLYDELKASIRERGLDTAPAVTRRPGASHYIIRNGGNTRLAILNELWSETRDERFFRIACLFRPWSPRGDIVALTGHLAENELHGRLSFIERALGVGKALELYQAELGQEISQSELARRLTADGFPVQQSHISRMQDAVRWLLPAIPNVLYGGLGRPQIERLTVLRRAAERVWARRAVGLEAGIDFPTLFQDVLVQFDGDPDAFAVQRVQDELVGQMAAVLQVNYELLQLEIDTPDPRPHRESLDRLPSVSADTDTLASARPAPDGFGADLQATAGSMPSGNRTPATDSAAETQANRPPSSAAPTPEEDASTPSSVPAQTTERLESIRQLIAQSLGNESGSPVRDHPVTAQSDTAPAAPAEVREEAPAPAPAEALRDRIATLAREIAAEAGVDDAVTPAPDGLGYRCTLGVSPPGTIDATGEAVLGLLSALGRHDAATPSSLPHTLGALLCGAPPPGSAVRRLSNRGLARLLHLIRAARRLHDGASPARVTTGL